jgi:serine protease Do
MLVPAFSSTARTIATVALLAALVVPLQACSAQGDHERSPSATAMEAAAIQSPDFVAVARAATPAVVNISTIRTVRAPAPGQADPFFEDPFFRRFFGDDFLRRFEVPRERRERSLGSGVIVSGDGYIVTNAHVIAGAEGIEVLLADDKRYSATVVGSDPKSDLAVIRIDARDLPALPWGDSDRLAVGQYVLAIGNPFGLNQTVTLGIVSAVGRANVGIAEYEDFIQTDAAINPGNSGGALVNVRGELVGINTAILSRSGGHLGIGFAVPSKMARAVMRSLIDMGRVVRGWLGVSIQPLTPALASKLGLDEPQGVLLAEVTPDSPAQRAGMQPGDVVIAFAGQQIRNPTVLRNVVAGTPVGEQVEMTILRDGQRKTLKVVLAEQPDEAARDEDRGAPAVERNALSGMEVRTLTPALASRLGVRADTKGVVVTRVAPGAAAERAGLREGDVIVAIERKPVASAEEFGRIAGAVDPKESVLLTIQREGRTIFVVLEPQ